MLNVIDELINETTLYLDEIQSLLGNLISIENNDLSDEERILIIQLVLQYRLNCEDALSFLLKMDHNLLYFLGIQPQQSSKMNLERLAYSIGNEDLKQILNVLAILTGSLSRLAARYKKEDASFILKNKKKHGQPIIIQKLSLLLAKQNQLLKVMHTLDLEIEQLLKLEAIGPVLDHIAALRGPISQFHQAILQGLEQGVTLYHQVNKKPVLNYQLHALIKETEQVLHLIPSTYSPHPNHPIKTFDHQTTSEQLEQRAAAKRLRPFFG